MNNGIMNNASSVICSRCGTVNAPNTSFCVRCRNPIQTQNQVQFNNNQINNGFVSQAYVQSQQTQQTQQTFQNKDLTSTMVNNTQNNNTTDMSNDQSLVSNQGIQNESSHINYFKYIFSSFIKPFDSFKKEEKALESFKSSAILTIIVVIFLMIINLVSTMIQSVRVTSFWNNEVQWVWENLKNVQYFKVLGQSLLIYLGFILAIGLVYYLAGLVLKKEVKFPKVLSAVVTAVIPFALATFILSPFLSLIHAYLGVAITIIGFVYSLIILLELINDIIVIENKNSRIYFHLICLSILFISFIFIMYKLTIGSLTSNINSLMH